MPNLQPSNESPASFTPLKTRTPHEAAAVAVALLALGLAGIGWPFWDADAGFSIPPFTLEYWFRYIIAFGGGVLAALFGLKQLYLITWLGYPWAGFARGASDQDSFVFRFVQQANRSLEARVITSLVLRETIRTEQADSQPTFTFRDHLAQAITHEPVRLGLGQRIHLDSQFRLPERGSAGFKVDAVPLSWVVKVQVDVASVAQFWHEFPLPLPVSSPVDAGPTDACFRVRVLQYPGLESAFKPPKPLLEVAPHLHQVMRMPFTVRENVTREVAEQVCRHLEAAGAVMELSIGDTIIPRLRVHDLPLPVLKENAGGASLPIAAQAEDRVSPELELRTKT